MESKGVVIIGNGPSAITLSYILAGNWPYYLQDSHPNEELDHRLKNANSDMEVSDVVKNISLVESDLEYLSQGLIGRSLNPISVLFDTLVHPEADFGLELPSTLYWKQKPEKFVDHVVIGKGNAGGSWQKMEDDDSLTVSLRSWMELPNMSIKEWNKETKRSESRVSFSTVAKYYKDYVKRQGLRKYFKNDAEVTEVRYNYNSELWEVSGYQEDSGNLKYETPKVVLATGNSDVPNRLGIAGEDLPFVLHSLNELERLLERKESVTSQEPVLVVGGGLSAADAVLNLRFHRIPVIHAFRKHPDDPTLIFNQLPENMYPEYHKVHSKMKIQSHSPNYKPFQMHSVHEIKESGEVVLRNLISTGVTSTICCTTVKVSFVVVLIGMKPNLKFLKPKTLRQNMVVNPFKEFHARNNPIKIHGSTYESISAPGIHVMGPLVGDNFVRFVQGGALAIANSIWRHK